MIIITLHWLHIVTAYQLSPEPSGAELFRTIHMSGERAVLSWEPPCGDYSSFLVIQQDSVHRTGPRSYYARGFGSFWTTSSSFAVWWAARRQVNSEALQCASDDSPSRASLRPPDNIPLSTGHLPDPLHHRDHRLCFQDEDIRWGSLCATFLLVNGASRNAERD